MALTAIASREPGLLMRAARHWRRTPMSFRLGAVILAIHVIAAATGPL